MSLMTRKACQPLLDKYGFAENHIRISEDKYCVISGPCGQPLITITGIKFTRMAPNNEEIEYALTLLEEFMLSHKQEFDDYAKSKKLLAKAVAPKLPANIEIDTETKWNSKVRVHKTVGYKATYTNPETGETLAVAYPGGYAKHNCNGQGWKETAGVLSTQVMFNRLLKLATEANKQLVAQTTFEEAKSSLESCEI